MTAASDPTAVPELAEYLLPHVGTVVVFAVTMVVGWIGTRDRDKDKE